MTGELTDMGEPLLLVNPTPVFITSGFCSDLTEGSLVSGDDMSPSVLFGFGPRSRISLTEKLEVRLLFGILIDNNLNRDD